MSSFIFPQTTTNTSTNVIQNLETFTSSYYSILNTVGYSHLMHFFDPDCVCNIDGTIMHGPYNFLNMLSQNKVLKLEISNLKGSHTIINNHQAQITAVYLASPVSIYNEKNPNSYYVTEVFVYDTTKNKIVNYTLFT